MMRVSRKKIIGRLFGYNFTNNLTGYDKVPRVPESKYLTDDLYFESENPELFGSFHKVIKKLQSNPGQDFTQRSIGYILYNMAMVNVKDQIVFDMLLSQLERNKGEFEDIFAFGGMFAVLKLNLKRKHFNYFREELERSDDLEPQKLVDLMTALTLNKNFSEEYKHQFIQGFLEPRFSEYWNKIFKYNHKGAANCRKVIDDLVKLRYFHTDLISKLIDTALNGKDLTNLTLVTIHETLGGLRKTEKTVFREFEKEWKNLNNLIEEKPQIEWYYDLESARGRTYMEMFERRDIENPNRQHFFEPSISQKQIEIIRQYKKSLEEDEREEEYIDKLGLSDVDILDLMNEGGIKYSRPEDNEEDDDLEDYDDYD